MAAGSGCDYLAQLPPELVVLISGYLPVATVRANLMLVCRRFRTIFAVDALWNTRLMARFPNTIHMPLYEQSTDFSWARECRDTEREYSRWVSSRENDTNKENTEPDSWLSGGHYACVDAVHQMNGSHNDIAVSGGRDRGICVWNMNQHTQGLSSDQDGKSPVCLKQLAHDGWIWSISSVGDRVYSVGWDCYVKEWALTNTELQLVGKRKLSAAVVSLVVLDNMLVAGTYDKRVYALDRRLPADGTIADLQMHTGAVLSVCGTDDHYTQLYSAAEDRSIVCTDYRMWDTLYQRHMPQYATSLSYGQYSMWASTSKGYLCLIDPHKQGLPSLKNMRVTANRNVAHVVHRPGVVLAATADRHLHVYSPGPRAKRLKTFGKFTCEPTRMDYRRGRLVCGFSDGNIGVWNDTEL